jgi:L-ascorbate metabolism protein UlaG (beta-lactamase superfamily)
MKITRFPQSCVVVEKNGRAILFDPGTLATENYKISDFGNFDAVIYTHRHADHLDINIVDDLIASGATLYGNSDVNEAIGGNKIEVIENGEELVVADFKVKTFDMPHCLMVDGSTSVPNTGFLINNHLLVPGDSTEDINAKAKVVAVPVFGPDISFHDAYRLMKSVEAKIAIPVHFDVAGMHHEAFGTFNKIFGLDLEVRSLGLGASTEV